MPASDNWFYVMMHPGENPLEELESALLRVSVNPPSGLMNQLADSDRGLLRALKRTLPDDNSELLLVLDQMEELFTLVEDEAVRVHFLKSLQVALEDPRSRLRVIATLRADFYDRPLIYPGIGELIRNSTAVVLPLNSAEIREAIVGPAERVGLAVERPLIDAIIQDVGETVGALPLLQYALTELFERRDGRTLTLNAYRDIGGVSGALARRAEEIYVELWEPTKRTARQVFLRLVNLGDGTEDTRRRVARSELLTLNPDEVEDAVEYCLDQFGKYRLITFDHDPQTREPTVEVAHEALIRRWGRLREWLEDNRDEIRTQRKLSGAAEEWAIAGRDPSFLARGTRLQSWREWRRTTSLTMNEVEEAFLSQSVAADEARVAEAREQAAREEALERRSLQRLRAFVMLAAVAALAGIALSITAFTQRQLARDNANALATSVQIADGERAEAERSAAEARSLALAASAQQAFGANSNDLAIALALEANTLPDPPAQSQRVLAEAAYAPGTRRVFEGHTNIVQAVTFTPDGQGLLSASADSTLRLWDAITGDTLQTFSGHTATVNDLDVSSNGLQIISASADGTVRLWDTQTGNTIASVRPADNSAVLTVEFNPDGRSALIGSTNNTAFRWDLSSSTLDPFSGHEGPVFDTAVNDRGTSFISASGDGTMRIWSAFTGDEIRRLIGHTTRILTVDISPDGITAISGDALGAVIAWDTRFGQQIKQFFGHAEAVNALAITPDGTHLVTGSQDGTVRVWNIDTSEEIRRFRGHDNPVTAIAISPDGRQIVSGAEDNTLRMWDLQSGAEVLRMAQPEEAFIDAYISSDGTFTLSGGRNGGLATWDLTTGTRIRELSTTKGTVGALEAESRETITAIALSPNDRLALSGTRDGTFAVWDVNSGTDLRRVEAHSGVINAAAFMADNRQVVTVGPDNEIVRTDVGTGDVLYRLNLAVDGTITRLRLVPDTETLVAATNTGLLYLLGATEGEVLREIGQHDDAVLAVDIHPDGTRALTGSRDESVRLWDIETGEQLLRLDGHTGSVTGVAISDDLDYAVSGSADRTLILWNLGLETSVQQLTGHTSSIATVRFMPGDDFVLSASFDGTLRKWQTLDLPSL
ncbi:MAG: WD40 repeat domain-containing protein, partial [Chloroflexota bacterium]